MTARSLCQARHILKGVVVLLLTISLSNSEATCKKGCPQSDSGVLLYKAGNVYDYSFESILTVGLTTTGISDTDDTGLKVTGTAKVFAEGNCGYVLQLGGVKVTATKESIEKKIQQNIQSPVHFTLVNGKLEPEICADDNDHAYALNIKRAVISLLQSSHQDESETDVFGHCATHTSVSKSGAADVITKVRNLNDCAYREHINSGIVNGIVNEQAGVKSTQLLQANFFKESKVEHGIVQHVQLVEEYTFSGVGATAKVGSAARAKVVTSLKVKNAAGAPAAPPAVAAKSKSIIFENPDTYTSKNLAALKTALAEAIQLVSDYVKKDSAKSFVELIRLMRNADAETLLELSVVPYPNKVLARKVYLDALFRTATAESAKATIKQLSKMDEKEKTFALISLNLIKVVDKETVNSAATLITPNALKETYLAVGNIVSKYCAHHDCTHGEIEAISKRFSDSLKHCKANTVKDEERIVSVLKGIGNMHHIASNTATSLAECASGGRANRLRVAALQAFSAGSCDASLQAKAFEILQDINEDSELRIEAYLAAVNCPTAELGNKLATLVNSEPVNQVGGFITSHLKAIRDSTDASRENQRYYLGNIRVTKQFPKDVRRYSFNNEVSYKLSALGVGASADYRLIYSQNGFLPRSARLNVTTELFGVNFNVFESSLRQENLEHVLEYYVGPKGLLNKDFDEIMKMIEVGSGGHAGGRARRSIADDAAKVAKKYKSYGSKQPQQDLNLDLSLKLFGSELMFLSLGDNIPSSLDDVIKYVGVAFEKVKQELTTFNKEFITHTLFLDTEFVYPTGVGLPLELSTQGFSANKVDFGLSLDIDAIIEQNWQRAKYRLKVVPSVDVSVVLQMGFNAHVLNTGLRVQSSLHSATGGDCNFAFTNDNGNEGFTVDVELPREKLQLVDLQISTDFYVAEQDKPTKSISLKTTKKRKPEQPSEMCFNQLEAIGFTICFNTNIPTDPASKTALAGKVPQGFLEELTHPLSFSLFVLSERRLNLKGKHIPVTAAGSQRWELDYSTPGSKQNHDTSVALELGVKPRTYGRVSFANPQYRFALEAGVNNDDKELVVYAQYENNNEVKKNKIGFEKRGNEYRPIIEVQDKNGVIKDINGYHADGKVVVQQTGDKQSRYNFENFQIINKNNERVVINGWTDVGPSALATELHIAPGSHSYLVKGDLKVENGEYVAGLFINDEKTPSNVIGGSAKIKLGQQDLNAQLVGKAGVWELDFNQKVQFNQQEGSTKILSSKFGTNVALKQKQQKVGSFELNGSTEGENKFHVDVEVTHGKRVAAGSIKFSRSQRVVQDYHLEVKGRYNKHFIDVLSKCDVNNVNRFAVENVLTTSWGTSLTAKGELGKRYSPQDIHIDLQGTAQVSTKEKPFEWLFKVIGVPEKTNSELRIVRESSELVKYTGELQHPQDKVTAGKFNLLIKNTVSAKTDFKIAKNGKGDLVITAETLKTEPKQKLELNTKFHVQLPKCDIEATAVYNGEKKLNFKTENTLDKQKFSTKNSVEFANKQQVHFDANGQLKGDWVNGELLGGFKFTTPAGEIIDGSLKRKISTQAKTGNKQVNAEITVSDQLPNGGKQRSVTFTAKADGVNVKTKEFNIAGNVIYKDFDGKHFDIAYDSKHLPHGQNKQFQFATSLSGELVTSGNIELAVEDYSKTHAVFKGSTKYGELYTANFNGNYKCADQGKPASYELQGNLNVPQSSFKTFTIQTSGKYLRVSKEEELIFEFHLDEKTGNEHFSKVNTVVKTSPHLGTYSIDIVTREMQHPVKLSGSYEREQAGSIKEGNLSGKQKHTLNFKYGDKFVNTAIEANVPNVGNFNLHYVLDSSFETAKHVDVDVHAQKLENNNIVVNAAAKHGSASYKIDSTFYQGSHKKGLDLQATLPNGQPVVVIGVFEVLGERKAKLTIQIDNVADLDFKANSEASFHSVDDFYVTANWHSTRLHLDSYAFDVHAQNKAITFDLKHAQGPIFAGTATYALKKENNKSIIEGQGKLQYQGKSHNTNFKLIRQHYDLVTDKEVGFSYTFNGNFGPKNGVSSLKITNKDFNVKLSICEEKKQCTNVQIQSLVTFDEQEFDAQQHSLLVLFDLRELGYPYEFHMQSKTIRQGLKLQYSLDSSIISNNNIKYQLIANVLPKSATVQLHLPARQILLETHSEYPESGQYFGHYGHSAVFYLDKVNKPNDATRLTSTVDITGIEQSVLNIQGIVKFEHPTIRPLVISGKLDANRNTRNINHETVFDIFRQPAQKIIVSCHLVNTAPDARAFNLTTSHVIKSEGLGFHYEVNGYSALNIERQEFSTFAELLTGLSDTKSSVYLFANREHVEASVYGLNEEILNLNGVYNSQKSLTKLDAKVQIFGQKPIQISSEVQPSLAKLSLKREGLLNANGILKLGKEFKFNAEGSGKKLFNGQVALDAANFLQINYESNSDEISAFLETVEVEFKKESEAAQEVLKGRFQKLREAVDKQIQLSKNSVPDLKPLKENYQGHVSAIAKELENDPALKQIAESYQKLYSKVVKLVGDLSTAVADTYEKVHKSVLVLYEKLQTIIKDAVLPAWEEFLVAATKINGRLRVEVVNFFTKITQSFLGLIEQYGPAIRNYTKAINESLKPIIEAAQELYKTLSHAIDEVLDDIREYLTQLPTFDAIQAEFKDQLKKLQLLERVLELLNIIFDQLHILPQTPETADLLEKSRDYLVAKLKQQQINDEQVLEELGKLLLKAVRSVMAGVSLNAPATALSLTEWGTTFSTLPYSVDVLQKLPALLSFRLSVLNFLLNEDWDQVLSKENLKSWLLFHDFELAGHIVDGQHIFTFDGQHYAFPGSCRYILAQDSVDNNFTVIGQLNNGKLKSLVLTDRDGTFIEVTDAGLLKLNGNPVEFPQHETGMHAWHMYYTVWLRSEYGIQVVCTNDLKICHINVDGFYTSKTRGLLGNGNAEPHDDYLQIDGTLATDSSALGNNYALGKCSPVAAPAPKPAHAEICSELFSLDSPLALGYLIEDPTPYREACDQSVAAAGEKDAETGACAVATAYGSALKLRHVFVILPPRCLKCTGAAGQREIGQEFSVKIPNNKADVVFVVDVGVSNTKLANLVAPAITEVRDTLKARGFTDIQIGVVAYNESQRYPALLTSNGGKLNYQGNLAELQLNGPKTFCESCVTQMISDKRVLDVYAVLEQFVKSLVPQSNEMAYRIALRYPFRAGAAKSIVAVRNEVLDYDNIFKVVRAHLAEASTSFDSTLLHLIGPVNDLALESVPSEKLVGFNSRLVATLDGKDAKKRQKLQFHDNLGVDYVLNNGGWVFATDNFDTLKPADQKKYLAQVTNTIADTMFKTEIGSDCICLPVNGLHAQHKCTIKTINFVPNKKVKATK